MEIDTAAPVIVRRRITIGAAPETVWAVHTDLSSWPTWNPDIDRVDGPDQLAVGSTFHWLTHGLEVTSTVSEIVPTERIAWGGPAQGITGIHVWIFTPTEDGTEVTTEESWSGQPVDAQRDELQVALDSSLQAWLDNLKLAAEAAAARPPAGTTP
jgi:uncharacterized protein YndB with AHSA1/START domain